MYTREKANTRYNLYNYNEYKLINHPGNKHHISNILMELKKNGMINY